MKKRRVFFVCNTLSGGGAEKQILLTALGLSKMGYHCEVLPLAPVRFTARDLQLVQACRANGVIIHDSNSRLRILSAALNFLKPSRLREETIVWSWGFRSEAFCSMLNVARGYRRIVALRSASPNDLQRRTSVLSLGELYQPYYISNSHAAVDLLRCHIKGIYSRASVVYNGIDLHEISGTSVIVRPHEGVLSVGMLGNIWFSTKGYDFALELAREIIKRNLPIRLFIGGKQVAGQVDIQREISRFSLGKAIMWLGAIENPVEFLRSVNCFLSLSRFEGTSNSLLEAMALGLPCISFDVGDVRRFSADGAGIKVFPVGDLRGVLNTLQKWAENPGEYRSLGAFNPTFCKKMFSESIMVKSSAIIIDRILEASPKDPL